MKFRCHLGHMVNQGPSDVEISKEFKYGEEKRYYQLLQKDQKE